LRPDPHGREVHPRSRFLARYLSDQAYLAPPNGEAPYVLRGAGSCAVSGHAARNREGGDGSSRER